MKWVHIKSSKKLELNKATTDRSIDIIEHEPIYIDVVTYFADLRCFVQKLLQHFATCVVRTFLPFKYSAAVLCIIQQFFIKYQFLSLCSLTSFYVYHFELALPLNDVY